MNTSVKSMLSTAAVVIFTSFQQEAKMVQKKLEESGWKGELLTAETPAKKRQGMVDNFQNGLSPVFSCTYGAGGVGLTLTAAHTVILLDRPWTPGDTHQAEDRVHSTILAVGTGQHIAFSCENRFRRATGCCFEDAPTNTKPSQGVSRMVGEWSASFDILPAARITQIMDGVAENGTALYFDRVMSAERKDFLRNFIEAQIVTFEADDVGTASAWFYWTVKMEGGAFAEWSLLRGFEEGWFPAIPKSDVASQSVFGTCYDILSRTDDSMDIVEEFPLSSNATDKKFTVIDDDVVLSHGESLLHPRMTKSKSFVHERWVLLSALLATLAMALPTIRKHCKRAKYSELVQDISF